MAIPEMLLVQNPYNGKHINILPLMELMNENLEGTDNGPMEVSAMIQHALDYFCIYSKPDTDLETFQTSIFYLSFIRQHFDKMKELR
jgi:hypothetical protein